MTARRPLAALAALVMATATATVATAAVARSAPAPAVGTPGPARAAVAALPTKGAHPVRHACAAVNKLNFARCFALVRTDIAPRPKGVTPHITPTGFGPTDLQSAYQLPSATAGVGQTVAVVDAFDDPNGEADLGVYRAQFGLTACTTANGCFRKVNQLGNASPLPPSDPGWATEISLDLDMVSAACPRCHILLVESDDPALLNLAAAVDRAVALGAKYVSNSYGGPEDPTQTGFDSSYDHPGVAVTASTGDGGFGTSYPATAPGVAAIGGTSLAVSSAPRGWSETAWGGAGSGCSTVTPKPSFQTDPGCANKSVADVSAVADPDTGVAVYDSFQSSGWAVFGGTSASSPLIASTYALAGTPAAGVDAESYPYRTPSALNDVTTGSNGSCSPTYLCTAGPGFDGPTGLGTPNGVAAFRIGQHGTLTGQVSDAATHAPVVGASVTAGTESTVTDSTGAYTMDLPAGTYTVRAAAYGYARRAIAGVVVPDNRTVTENVALTAVPSLDVSGTITDGSGKNWPLYAKITVEGVPGAPVYTDPFTGRFDMHIAGRHTYSMTVEAVYPGYTPRTFPLVLASSSVTKHVALSVTSSCGAPGYRTRFVGPVEHFNAATIPSSWTIVDNTANNGGVWVANDLGGRGNLTGGTGNFAIIDSDNLGPGKRQDTELISPVVDMTNDPAPIVGLNSAYKSFFNSAAAIDYSIDGGVSWRNVWRATTTDQQGPLELNLATAAGQRAVRVRLHYRGSFSFFWEVDDVFLGQKSCVLKPGGLVAGLTRDGNTGAPLNGVKVTSNDPPADSGVSAATPADGALPDGFYWLFSSATGARTFTAAASRYTSAAKRITVGSDSTTRLNFVLGAGRIATNVAGLSGTVTLGGALTRTFQLSNTGTAPVHVQLGEQGGAFQIAGHPAAVAYAQTAGAAVHRVAGRFTPRRMTAARTGVAARPAATPADPPWEAIADYPTAISNNSGSENDGRIYSVGGFDGNVDVASAYVYDPALTSWTKLADMSETREAPSSAWLGGKLYVTGGWGPDGTPSASTEVFDPAAGSWSAVADNPSPHAGASAVALDGKLVVSGGCDATSCGSTDVVSYDPSSDSWTAGPAYPEPVAWESCGAIGGIDYCAGGTTDAGSILHTYAFDGSGWTPLADLPIDDWGAGYSAANGLLVVSGGVVDNSSSVTNEGWSYDPAADAWTALPNSNDSVFRLGGACGFYKIGGAGGAAPAQTGSEVLPGFDTCGDSGADVEWLAETPAETDLAPGHSARFTVPMDSSALAQPGTYTAGITIATDTPYRVAPAPATFHVLPPATWGKISGAVVGLPCTGSAAPIAGATVQVNTWAASYTLSTDNDGRYALWLDRRNNPLTVIVAKDGWQPQTRTVRVTPGAPLTADFSLRPTKACR